jgi:helicase
MAKAPNVRSRSHPPEKFDELLRRAADAAREIHVPCPEATLALLGAAAWLARHRGRTILFVPTRYASRRCARLLDAMLPGSAPARVALASLARCPERGRVPRRLAETLARGVAFHNADLGPALRLLVERAFDDGEVSLLVSTPTLGLGVNLAADCVVHTPWRLGSPLELTTDASSIFPDDFRECPAAAVPLPLGRLRFANQGGRAARWGFGETPGLSVLVARSRDEAERLWETFILAPDEGIDRPPLAGYASSAVAVGLLTRRPSQSRQSFPRL